MTKKTQTILPPFDDVVYYEQVVDLKPPASLRANDSYTASQASNNISTNDPRLCSLVPAEHAKDDTMAQVRLRDMSTISLTIEKRRIFGRRETYRLERRAL